MTKIRLTKDQKDFVREMMSCESKEDLIETILDSMTNRERREWRKIYRECKAEERFEGP